MTTADSVVHQMRTDQTTPSPAAVGSSLAQLPVHEPPAYGSAWANRLLRGDVFPRDAIGAGFHPDTPSFELSSLAAQFFALFGLQLTTVYAQEQLEMDDYLQVLGASNFASWTPEPPEGTGWALIAVFDSDDGPAAWWLRRQAKTCEISQTRTTSLDNDYPVMPEGTEVTQFTSDAKVYTEEDMHAYLDADRLTRPFHSAMDQFFSYHPDQGMRIHFSGFEAQQAAKAGIQPNPDGSWPKSVGGICWGVLRQQAGAQFGGDSNSAAAPLKYVLQDSMGDTSDEPSNIVPLAHTRETRVYVAGPMTGIEHFNYPAFNAAAQELRNAGWHVENPADHGVVDGAEWADYLHYDLGRLATCSAIYLLPGWTQSRGAHLEFTIAKTLGMTIAYHKGAEIPEQDDCGDPLEMPLPCAIKIGNITLRKGVALRLLVTRTKQLFEMATGQAADEVASQSIAERQRKLLALQVAVGSVEEGAETLASNDQILMPSMESLQDHATLCTRAATGAAFSAIESFAHAYEPKEGSSAWRADLFDLLRHYIQRGNVNPGAINNEQFNLWWHKHMLWAPVDDGFEAWKDAVNTGICASALSGISMTSEQHIRPTLEALIALAIAAYQIDLDSMVDDNHSGNTVEVPISSLEALGLALNGLHELPNSPGNPNQLPATKAAWVLRELLKDAPADVGRTLKLRR